MTDERPEGAQLLDEVRTFFARYVVVPGDHYFDAIALWVAHAHALPAADSTPRLLFQSPEKECGKTRALEVLELLTPNPLPVMNTTVAAIFRLLAAEQVTILLDEADAIFSPKAPREHEDLRALLNAGHRRGAEVARVTGEGKKMKVQRFPVYAANSIASIGALPETIESRAIPVPMRRKAPGERVEAFRRRRASEAGNELRDRIAAWTASRLDVLAEADPEMPEGVTDRAADCWEPLLAIADDAGGDWPERGRKAAALIVGGRSASDQSRGVRLLADVRALLNGEDRVASAELVRQLNKLDESAWGGWHDGKGLTPRDLSRMLRPFGVESKTVRLEDDSTPTAKGYLRRDFADAWSRYLRVENVTNGEAVTETSQELSSELPFVTDVTDVTSVGVVAGAHTRESAVPPGSVTSVTGVTPSSNGVSASEHVTDGNVTTDADESEPDLDNPKWIESLLAAEGAR